MITLEQANAEWKFVEERYYAVVCARCGAVVGELGCIERWECPHKCEIPHLKAEWRPRITEIREEEPVNGTRYHTYIKCSHCETQLESELTGSLELDWAVLRISEGSAYRCPKCGEGFMQYAGNPYDGLSMTDNWG